MLEVRELRSRVVVIVGSEVMYHVAVSTLIGEGEVYHEVVLVIV